jgi:hypothetical protein
MKKEYVLLRERLPFDLLRLQWLMDWNLRCDSEMVKALVEKGGYGNHGGKKDVNSTNDSERNGSGQGGTHQADGSEGGQ